MKSEMNAKLIAGRRDHGFEVPSPICDQFGRLYSEPCIRPQLLSRFAIQAALFVSDSKTRQIGRRYFSPSHTCSVLCVAFSARQVPRLPGPLLWQH